MSNLPIANVALQANQILGVVMDYAIGQGFRQVSPDRWSHPFANGSVVYISGPMSNISNHNREAFWLAEMAINLVGIQTVSPAHWPNTWEYDLYMRKDFELVLQATTIFALRNWNHSPGARAEIEMGRKMGFAIHEEA